MNPPGVFKKSKGKRNLGEKFDSKFYPDNYKKDVLYMNYNDLLDDIYMENKGIDFGLRSYDNYNKFNSKRKKRIHNTKKQTNKNEKPNIQIEKEEENDLMKKYVNNQFTFKHNDDLNENININQDDNLEPNNDNNYQENNLENLILQNNSEKENNNYEEQNIIVNDENDDINKNIEYEDIRLNYVMMKLGLESLIPIFEQNHMSFNDILFLTKEDLNELGLKIFQKNRLISFIEEYSSQASNYSLDEIQNFFENNKIYNISDIQE